MNKKNFERWMNSIDDTYLEEAARPAKAKISYRALVLAAAACLVLTATGLILRHAVLSEGSATPDTTLAKNQETEDGITKEQFTKEGISYTLLTCTANEPTDISGMEASDTEPLVWVAGGLELKLCSTKDIAWSSWYDTNTNTQWCLKANTSSLALLTTAKDIVEELGYNVAVAPEGATDITYDAFLLNDLTVAETTFVLDGIRYSYRMAATYEITEDTTFIAIYEYNWDGYYVAAMSGGSRITVKNGEITSFKYNGYIVNYVKNEDGTYSAGPQKLGNYTYTFKIKKATTDGHWDVSITYKYSNGTGYTSDFCSKEE